jgi:hypothetical protein
MKVDITKELEEKRLQTKNDANEIVKETKLLLEGDHQKEADLLKRAGLGHQLKKAETAKGINLERSNLEGKFEGKIFTTTEIKELCLEYDLRFLNTKHYKGDVDLQIGPKLKRLFETQNLNENVDTERLYIMAPKQAFNLQDRPKPPKMVDPVLFYRVTNYTTTHGNYDGPSDAPYSERFADDDKFLMVHNWGNDFTIMRLFLGVIMKTALHQAIFRAVTFMLLFNVFMASFGSYTPVFDLILSIPIGAFLSFVTMWFLPWTSPDNWNDVANRYGAKCWNSFARN